MNFYNYSGVVVKIINRAMASELHLTSDAIADRIAKWKPEDGYMTYYVSESFTADVPDVQKFDVNSTPESLLSKNRANASRYTVSDISSTESYGNNLIRAYKLFNETPANSLIIFEDVPSVMAIRRIIGRIANTGICMERFDEFDSSDDEWCISSERYGW